jgi:hypothetical protein
LVAFTVPDNEVIEEPAYITESKAALARAAKLKRANRYVPEGKAADCCSACKLAVFDKVAIGWWDVKRQEELPYHDYTACACEDPKCRRCYGKLCGAHWACLVDLQETSGEYVFNCCKIEFARR